METVDERTGKKVAKTAFVISSGEDFARLRGLWSQMPMIPKVTRVEDSPALELPGSTIRILLNGQESGGSVSVFYQEVEPGFGALPHHQPNEEEHFFILEGELEMTIGNQTIHATPGTFAFAPRNATHAFKNKSDRLCRFLTWNSPAGHERNVRSWPANGAKRDRGPGAQAKNSGGARHDLSRAVAQQTPS